MVWLDAQLSPALAPWIASALGIPCQAVRDLGLRNASDRQIFQAARAAGAIVLTKDSDFVVLQGQLGIPPKIIWLTCGNTSEAALQQVLAQHLPTALALLAGGEELVEIGQP